MRDSCAIAYGLSRTLPPQSDWVLLELRTAKENDLEIIPVVDTNRFSETELCVFWLFLFFALCISILILFLCVAG